MTRRLPKNAAVLVRFRAVVSFLLLVSVGCRGQGGMREWAAGDHDDENPEQTGGTGQGVPTSGAGASSSAMLSAAGADADDALVEATWTANCAKCHGPGGRGDGPEGPMVKAPDLTVLVAAKQLSDEQMAGTIRTGRGRMPAFPKLPATMVARLIHRIRHASATTGAP